MLDFKQELNALRAKSLLRSPFCFENNDEIHLKVDGKQLINFSSNDYLGLSKDPRVIGSAVEALKQKGLGSGASRLVCGTLHAHRAIESQLARFKQKEGALVFPTGYMTNVGVITSLVGKGDLVVMDKLSHASIIDACQMSGATLRIFPHKHYARLDEILAKNTQHKVRLIVTDSVFSMDGDSADLCEMVEIKKRHNALLMIDEAHATGVFGDHGRGLAEACGCEYDIDIAMGTLSKALGGLGGFVAGSRDCMRYIENKARSFIYTTALPVSVCAGVMQALTIIENEPKIRKQLWDIIAYTCQQLDTICSIQCDRSPIIPIIVGSAEQAVLFSKRLFDRGFFVPAIRYPTVAKNKARLRISLSSKHTCVDIDALMYALHSIYK